MLEKIFSVFSLKNLLLKYIPNFGEEAMKIAGIEIVD